VSSGAFAVLWVVLGAAAGGGVVALTLRRRVRATAAPRSVPAAPDGTAGAAPGAAPGVTGGGVGGGAPDAATAASVGMPVGVPALHLRPHPSDRTRIGATALIRLGRLGDVVSGGAGSPGQDPLSPEDLDALATAVEGVVDGGVLALPGPGLAVLRHALRALHDRLGDVAVLGVPDPRRVGPLGRVHAPLQALIDDPSPVATEGRCVVLVEDAELHLRRGLDRRGLDALRAAAPAAVIVLHVGACEHDASIVDDEGRWLSRMLLAIGGDRFAAAGAHHPELDVPLLEAVEHAPLLADLAEAAAYARAAGRLPDVPLAVAARVAALLAGDPADRTATDGELGAALAADTSDTPLLHFDALDRSGLPVAVRTSAVLVARCAADPDVLGPDLLAALLDDADPVEQLLLARRLAASERPDLALPVLERLAALGATAGADERFLAEVRLVRGVVRDRLGLATAADDYHAVATGDHGALSAHGAFLLGGILETAADPGPARAAYRSAIAADDPVHSAMAAFNLAWLDEREGRTDAALDAYREVVSSGHPDAAPMAALNLATLLERGKRFAESESWYRTAIESGHPDVAPMAAVSLGLMLERRQRPREARVLFRTAASSGHVEAGPIALRRLGAPRR